MLSARRPARRQSVDYSVTANKAVLDYASRHREQLLYNIWLMGKLALFGPEILFRAQPHGTFKFLFNGIIRAGVKE